ncbi:MAG: alpha/beta fold hydrolase [Pararhodobacter sp.]
MPPILALPGLLCTHAVFADLQAQLPGHHMACPAIPALDDFEAIADALAQHLQPETTLLGMSMGAYLALALTQRFPAQVSRLVLVGASARPDTPQGAESRHKVVGWARKVGADRLAEGIADQMLGAAQRQAPHLRARLREMANAIGLETFARHQSALTTRPDARPALPGITCPALVITGAEDSVTPPDHGRELAEGLPNGWHLVLEGIGHMPVLEAPETVARALARFLPPSEART